MPLFARGELRAGLHETGLIATIPGLVALTLATPFGMLSDKVGRAPILFLSGVVTGTAILSIAVSAEVLHLLLAVGLAGIAIAMIDTAAPAAIGDVSRMEDMGKSFGLLLFSVNFGTAAGLAVAGYLADALGFRIPFVILGSLGLLASIVSLPFLVGKDKLKKPDNKKEKRKIKSDVWIGWLSIFFLFCPIGGVQVFLPIYAKSVGFGEAFIGLLVASSVIMGAVSRIPSGAFLDRFGREAQLALLGLIVLSIPTLGLIPIRSPAILFTLMGLIGLGWGMTGVAGNVLIAKGTTEVSRGLAMGLSATSRYSGLTLGPAVVTGILVFLGENSFGFQVAFVTLGAIGLVGALAVYGMKEFFP